MTFLHDLIIFLPYFHQIHFEREQQLLESSSDAGISATESTVCELSRQASKTESCEGAVDTNPGDQVSLLCFIQESSASLPFSQGQSIGHHTKVISIHLYPGRFGSVLPMNVPL